MTKTLYGSSRSVTKLGHRGAHRKVGAEAAHTLSQTWFCFSKLTVTNKVNL